MPKYYLYWVVIGREPDTTLLKSDFFRKIRQTDRFLVCYFPVNTVSIPYLIPLKAGLTKI